LWKLNPLLLLLLLLGGGGQNVATMGECNAWYEDQEGQEYGGKEEESKSIGRQRCREDSQALFLSA
jgi:hypothetical protein